MIFLYFLIAIMPLANHPIWSQFVGTLTLTKYVGAACLCYAVVHLCATGAFPQTLRSAVAKSLLGFYGAVLLSYFTMGLPRQLEFSPILSYTSFLLLFLIIVSIVDDATRFRRTLFASIGGLAFASLYLIREWQVYKGVYANFRPGWISGDANYFTVSALLLLPLTLYLLSLDRPRGEKAFMFVCAVLMLLAVTLAASRGGFLGLVAGFAYIVLKSGQRFRKLALVAILVAPLILFSPLSPLKRLLNPDRSDQAAAQDRIVVWKAGLEMIRQNPWRGIGVGNFKSLVLRYEEGRPRVSSLAHNTYIEVAAEMGLPGLAIFLSIFAFAFRGLRRAQREGADSEPFLSACALGLQAGLISAMVAIFFLSAESQKLLWLVVFLSPCLESLATVEHAPATTEVASLENLPEAAVRDQSPPGRAEWA